MTPLGNQGLAARKTRARGEEQRRMSIAVYQARSVRGTRPAYTGVVPDAAELFQGRNVRESEDEGMNCC
jgi:hypothetical protein